MKKLFRLVQFGANLGIIVLALLLAFVVIHQYIIFPDSSRQNQSSPPDGTSPTTQTQRQASLVGMAMPLKDVNWEANGKTLVMYLSTTCGYCNASVPFYQRLEKAKPQTGLKMIAVFLQNQDVATQYLNANKVGVDEIISGSLQKVGISGTPTILLVDKKGVISDLWVGKLTEEKEAEVLAKLTS